MIRSRDPFRFGLQRHICIINPVAAVKSERLSVVEGTTSEITYEEVRLYGSPKVHRDSTSRF